MPRQPGGAHLLSDRSQGRWASSRLEVEREARSGLRGEVCGSAQLARTRASLAVDPQMVSTPPESIAHSDMG
jgi:hypothetical protein